MNYYGQSMAMRVPTVYRLRERDGEETLWNLCGSLCTVNDILVKQLPVKNLQPGDVFVFEKTGAYSVTEGMALFLSRDLPAVVFRNRRPMPPVPDISYKQPSYPKL